MSSSSSCCSSNQKSQVSIAPLKSKQPCREWRNWTFPDGSGLTLVGYSRSADKTFFLIKEIGVCLDAGYCRGRRTQNIFVTHSHIDHTRDLPYMALRGEGTKIFCPKSTKPTVLNYISAEIELNTQQSLQSFFPTLPYQVIGVESGDIITGLGKKYDHWRVKVFQCFHAVDCVGFAFYETRKKLKAEYQGIPGRELAALRKQGKEISELKSFPRFAYVGDTGIDVFTKNEFLLEEIPIIIVECTFLDGSSAEMLSERAERDGHIVWSNREKPQRGLETIVKAHPEITFVLIHFSLRYSTKEIQTYFSQQENIGNVVIFPCHMSDS